MIKYIAHTAWTKTVSWICYAIKDIPAHLGVLLLISILSIAVFLPMVSIIILGIKVERYKKGYLAFAFCTILQCLILYIAFSMKGSDTIPLVMLSQVFLSSLACVLSEFHARDFYKKLKKEADKYNGKI